MTNPTLKNFQSGETIHFEASGSWSASHYLLDKQSAYALEMALATRRPLLVKGEPGMGKSYLARAAAQKLGRTFIAEVININTEGQDLLWREDRLARLNDAQARLEADDLNPKYYLNPGVLWWAFDWSSAKEQYDPCRHKVYRPQACEGEVSNQGVVLLIDEIDKAEPSLPNSLLEVLGNGGFDVPLLGKTIGKKSDQAPLVIITTNDERELPPAFLRRCLVLHLKVAEDKLESWLLERADVHFSEEKCSHAIKLAAAQQLKQDRDEAEKQGMVKAGLAEYLDLLAALNEMTNVDLKGAARDQYQTALLGEIQDFVLKKAI